MGEAAYFGFDCVLHTPPPLPPQQPCPIPFSLSPCEPRLFWQNQLAELIFKEKNPQQNWPRGHFEATQKAIFFPTKDFEPPIDPFDNFTNQRI